MRPMATNCTKRIMMTRQGAYIQARAVSRVAGKNLAAKAPTHDKVQPEGGDVQPEGGDVQPKGGNVQPKGGNENSAIAQRFQQIVDNKISFAVGTPSTLSSDPGLKSIYDKYSGNPSDEQVRASVYIKSESVLDRNKHAKDIYNSRPWTGTESVHDANMRMILDTKPGAKPTHDRIFTPPVSLEDRLTNAKGASLDYKLGKDEKSESEQFRQMYKERLLGPAMLVGNSPGVDLVNSIASNRINASLNQTTGKFEDPNMVHVRGKPLDRQHLRNSRDSNYFMNQVLNKQQTLPPWVESQQNIASSMSRYRDDLDKLWFNWIVNRSALHQRIHAATSVAMLMSLDHEVKIIQYKESFLSSSELEYVREKTKLLNANIRSYNLQSPSTSLHKMKLIYETELRNAFARTMDSYPVHIEQWFIRHKGNGKLDAKSKSDSGFLNLWGSGGSGVYEKSDHYQRPDNSLGLWKAVKDVLNISK